MDELTREMDFSTGMSGEKGESPAADGSVTKLASCQKQITHTETLICILSTLQQKHCK